VEDKMVNEHGNIICDHCGKFMSHNDYFSEDRKIWMIYWRCDCGWIAPIGEHKTYEGAMDAAVAKTIRYYYKK
jgi:hypothetical protein